jgi:hypothetical protein
LCENDRHAVCPKIECTFVHNLQMMLSVTRLKGLQRHWYEMLALDGTDNQGLYVMFFGQTCDDIE